MMKVYLRRLFSSFVFVLMSGLLPLPPAAVPLFAQDTLYLDGGSALYGKIITNEEKQVIAIENDCGMWRLKADEIVHWKYGTEISDNQFEKSGYYNVTSFALLMGEGREGFRPIPSITMINGYQFSSRLFAGAGIGFEYYNWSVMPLFGEFRFLHSPGKFSPFLSFKLGYSFPLEKEVMQSDWQTKTYGGILLSPELGIQIPLNNRSAIVMSLGYHYQMLSHDEVQVWGWGLVEEVSNRVYTNYNRISLRFGFMFK